VAIAIALLAAACSGDPTSSGDNVGPTATATSGPETGTLDVRVTDQPDPDITAIVITAEKVQVHKAGGDDEGGWITVVEGEFSFDLLKVISKEESIGVGELEPGMYTQTRITVLDVQVTKGGEQLTAEVPSGELKLVGPLEVIAGETTILTLDFNAERSIVEAGGRRLIFRPTVKLLVRKRVRGLCP
jgi:hypothetical protein